MRKYVLLSFSMFFFLSGFVLANPIHINQSKKQTHQKEASIKKKRSNPKAEKRSKKIQQKNDKIRKRNIKNSKKGKVSFFKKRFKSKEKEQDYMIKNKWMRISVKIFLWTLLIFSISLAAGLAGITNPHTFLGSFVTFSFILYGIALIVNIAALISIIITGIVLLLKR